MQFMQSGVVRYLLPDSVVISGLEHSKKTAETCPRGPRVSAGPEIGRAAIHGPILTSINEIPLACSPPPRGQQQMPSCKQWMFALLKGNVCIEGNQVAFSNQIRVVLL